MSTTAQSARKPSAGQNQFQPENVSEESSNIALLALPQLFGVTAHRFRVAARHRIAIDRHQRIFRIAARELLSDPAANFHERLQHLKFNDRPIRFLQIARDLLTLQPHPLASRRDGITQRRLVDQLFRIAQTIRPRRKVITQERTARRQVPAVPSATATTAIYAAIQETVDRVAAGATLLTAAALLAAASTAAVIIPREPLLLLPALLAA